MGEIARVTWLAGWTEQDFMSAVVKAGGMRPGSVVLLEYRHDEGCPRTSTGRACKCDPDVLAVILPAEAPRAA